MFLSTRKSKNLATLALAACFAAGPVLAHGPDDVRRAHNQKWPQASLQAQASAEVKQDTVKITLATEVSDKDQAGVTQQLNKALDSVMADASGSKSVQVSSGNYRVWPMNDRDGNISNWRGRGEILLESTDFEAASNLASVLSSRMPVADMVFSVSPQARAKQEQELLSQAAKAFQDRAQNLTQAFGYQSYTIREIDLSGAGAQYQPVARMMASAMDASEKARVPVQGGTEEVSVSVRGSIFLQPAQR